MKKMYLFLFLSAAFSLFGQSRTEIWIGNVKMPVANVYPVRREQEIMIKIFVENLDKNKPFLQEVKIKRCENINMLQQQKQEQPTEIEILFDRVANALKKKKGYFYDKIDSTNGEKTVSVGFTPSAYNLCPNKTFKVYLKVNAFYKETAKRIPNFKDKFQFIYIDE